MELKLADYELDEAEGILRRTVEQNLVSDRSILDCALDIAQGNLGALPDLLKHPEGERVLRIAQELEVFFDLGFPINRVNQILFNETPSSVELMEDSELVRAFGEGGQKLYRYVKQLKLPDQEMVKLFETLKSERVGFLTIVSTFSGGAKVENYFDLSGVLPGFGLSVVAEWILDGLQHKLLRGHILTEVKHEKS